MPVLGLVLILDDAEVATRESVARGLAGAAGIELGTAAGHRWPSVLESSTTSETEARIDALRRVEGVANVDIVYADFEDITADAHSSRPPEGS